MKFEKQFTKKRIWLQMQKHLKRNIKLLRLENVMDLRFSSVWLRLPGDNNIHSFVRENNLFIFYLITCAFCCHLFPGNSRLNTRKYCAQKHSNNCYIFMVCFPLRLNREKKITKKTMRYSNGLNLNSPKFNPIKKERDEMNSAMRKKENLCQVIPWCLP